MNKRLSIIVGVSVALIASTVYVGNAMAGSATPQGPTPASQTGVVRVAPPHVVPQAQGLTGAVLAPQAPRTVAVQPFSDGCDHGYGSNAQCIPLRAPGNMPVTCSYLRSAGYLPLTVNVDHLHLVRRGAVCG